jgi:pilus assembly protein CpaC
VKGNEGEFMKGSMQPKSIKYCLAFWAVLGALAATGFGQAVPPSGDSVVSAGLDPDGRLTLSVNRGRVLETSAPLKNAGHEGAALMEGSSDLATVSPLSQTSILVTGKKPGSTNLIIEDETGRRQIVEIIVEADLGAMRDQLKTLNPAADIQASDVNGNVVLRGRVPNLQVADQAAQIAAAYAGGAAKVTNLLEVSGGQQVMLEVKFAEVSKSVSPTLGVNFGYTDGTTFIGNNIGRSIHSRSARVICSARH